MKITILGCVLIPISIYMFIKSNEMLLYMAIFFAPFSASSVLNIESITYGLSPAYLFLILWMLKKITLIINKKISLISIYNDIKMNNNTCYKFVNSIFIIILIIFISLFMPIIFNGDIKVLYPDKGDILQDLTFKRIHITQTLYFIYMLLIPLFMLFEELNKVKIRRIFNTVCYSVIFCNLWGLYQILSKILGLPYIWQIFNNNISYVIGKNIQVFHNIPRINSVAPEPSVYSFYLIMVIGILMGVFLSNKRDINKKLLNFSLSTSIIVLILTFSSTAYISFIFLIIFIILNRIRKNREMTLKDYLNINYKIIISIIIFIVIIILLLLSNKNLVNLLYDITFNKINTVSGNGRLYGMKVALYIFSKYPILGVGWGSNRSFDLITTLLSNIGIVGFCVFALMQYYIIRSIQNIDNSIIRDALLYSLVIGLFVYSISIPEIVFVHFWLICGFSVAISNINRYDKK